MCLLIILNYVDMECNHMKDRSYKVHNSLARLIDWYNLNH